MNSVVAAIVAPSTTIVSFVSYDSYNYHQCLKMYSLNVKIIISNIEYILHSIKRNTLFFITIILELIKNKKYWKCI